MKLLLYIFVALSLFSLTLPACQGDASNEGADVAVIRPENLDSGIIFIENYLIDDGLSEWDSIMAMPDKGSIKLEINYPGGKLGELFCDSNELHYETGERLGIEPLIHDVVSWPMRRPLERVTSNQYYYVDNLKHSYPYLVPEGKALLDEIAERFHDTLEARGGGPYRLKVTSLLRTRHSVEKLRRVNKASVDSSAHLFGTTFDLSFTNFPYSGGEPHRTQEDLKNLLAEILYEVRNEGKCYIIYEHKPGCFHVTARK